jgi:predicted AAA+ superfamily ATPase
VPTGGRVDRSGRRRGGIPGFLPPPIRPCKSVLDLPIFKNRDRLWIRGSFPRAFLGSDDRASLRWRDEFIRTFLERDVPQLGITVPAETLRRFWTMIAHYHGQVWNAAQFARSLGTSEGAHAAGILIDGGAGA